MKQLLIAEIEKISPRVRTVELLQTVVGRASRQELLDATTDLMLLGLCDRVFRGGWQGFSLFSTFAHAHFSKQPHFSLDCDGELRCIKEAHTQPRMGTVPHHLLEESSRAAVSCGGGARALARRLELTSRTFPLCDSHFGE
jgi:hypothetical protein